MATAAPHANDGIPTIFHVVARYSHLIVPLSFLALIGVLVVPLPAVILDLLICLNIAIGAIILMTTIYMRKPLDFSVFPALLLGTTLLRLVLNVATTRLILSIESKDPATASTAAGHVIQAFANFVAGSNAVVGAIIFVILVIVQFLVITKGATRMSEVAARFTLDAMPGKQMAIDADLSAGMIDEKEARNRRDEVSREADFYGAMDGASKFVRGDAIAGILITIINIVAGFAIAKFQLGWSATDAMKTFAAPRISGRHRIWSHRRARRWRKNCRRGNPESARIAADGALPHWRLPHSVVLHAASIIPADFCWSSSRRYCVLNAMA